MPARRLASSFARNALLLASAVFIRSAISATKKAVQIMGIAFIDWLKLWVYGARSVLCGPLRPLPLNLPSHQLTRPDRHGNVEPGAVLLDRSVLVGGEADL